MMNLTQDQSEVWAPGPGTRTQLSWLQLLPGTLLRPAQISCFFLRIIIQYYTFRAFSFQLLMVNIFSEVIFKNCGCGEHVLNCMTNMEN